MSGSDFKLHVDRLEGVGNWKAWKLQIMLVLEEHSLEGYVDGSMVKPIGGADDSAWVKHDKKARRIILMSIKPELLVKLGDIDTSKGVWDRLVQLYESSSLVNKLYLRRKFFNLRMNEGDNVSEHINVVRDLANTLGNIGSPLTEADQVMQLLISLPESYDGIISQLEGLDESKLTYSTVESKLISHQQRKLEYGVSGGNGGGEQAMVAGKPKYYTRKPGEPIVCFYCNKPGHMKHKCHKFLATQQQFVPSEAAKLVVGDSGSNEVVWMSSLDSVDGDCWYIDSAATSHMTFNKGMFSTYVGIEPKKVYMGDNSMVHAIGIGTVKIQTSVNGSVQPITLSNVLYVPGLKSNLVSVPKLTMLGFGVMFNNGGCDISGKDGVLVAQGKRAGNLYVLLSSVNSSVYYESACAVRTTDSDIWHRRMAHIANSTLQHTISSHAVSGLNIQHVDNNTCLCHGCMLGKHSRPPFPRSTTTVTSILQLIHTDVGVSSCVSLGGSRYWVSFTDHYSKYVVVYPIHSKNQVVDMFIKYKALVENQHSSTIKCVRSDNGGEYIGSFSKLLEQHGIRHELSAPYTPQQNGIAERGNRTLVELARSMLHGNSLDKSFWAEALVSAAYIRNRVVSSTTDGKTPYELWHGIQPSVHHLRVFGCLAYVHIPQANRSKFDPKSKPCIFVGYSPSAKAYRLWDPVNKKIITSRDVMFDENNTYQPPSSSSSTSEQHSSSIIVSTSNGDSNEAEPQVEELIEPVVVEPVVVEPVQQEVEPAEQPIVERRYPLRDRQQTNNQWFIASNPDSGIEIANVAYDIPHTYQQAVCSDNRQQWENALDAELTSLHKNNTWSLVERPVGAKLVGCRWVFSYKYTSTGEIERSKARLVAQGFTQREGIDYHETYAPVVRMSSIRVLLSIAAIHNLEIHQMDVKTAFLNGDLHEEIYMKQPEGSIQVGQEHLVCKLNKTLYGLKQSPREWYNKIDSFFTKHGFKRVDSDYGLYVIWDSETKFIISLYVDDMLLVCDSIERINHIKQLLSKEYEMSDLGEAKYILGIEIERDRSNNIIYLSQSNYVKNVLDKFDMTNSHHVSTPLDPGSKLVSDMTPDPSIDRSMYQSIVGSLMYAMTSTRPDLAYAVGTLSRFTSNPCSEHMSAAKHVLKYLKGTAGYKLKLGGKQVLLHGYCDASWISSDSAKSVSGYAFYVGDGCVTWSSKRQSIVALSTAEAEYMSATHGSKELLWLKQLLESLGFNQPNPIVMYCDNQACIQLTKNPVHHQRTKHISAYYHFSRDLVKQNIVIFNYCNTKDMIADIFTKPLTRDYHNKHSKLLGLSGSIKLPASGSVVEQLSCSV